MRVLVAKYSYGGKVDQRVVCSEFLLLSRKSAIALTSFGRYDCLFL